MDLLDRLKAIGWRLADVFLSFGAEFSLPSLLVACAVAIGFLAWRQHRRRGRVSLAVIRRAVFRRRYLTDRSLRADIGFFLLNTLATGAMIGWALIGAGATSAAVSGGLASIFGARTPVEWPEFPLRAGVTLALFIAYEFGYWLDHFLKHQVPFLWATHKPHHSAETLTPWTVWRVHPLDSLVFANITALVLGAASGLITFALGRDVKIFAVDGANIVLVFFVYAYVHLQHSQFWIPFTGPVGKALMSPAHHQIHHSIDPAHHNKNFGSCLSLFDWMFGTLEMPPAQSPRLKFGVDQGKADPHSMIVLLIRPLLTSLRLLTSGVSGMIRAARAALDDAGRPQAR